MSIEDIAVHIMGVESNFGEISQQQEELSQTYFELLENKNGSTPSVKTHQLDELESKIIDPATRAFLQMKRLKKQVTQTI